MAGSRADGNDLRQPEWPSIQNPESTGPANALHRLQHLSAPREARVIGLHQIEHSVLSRGIQQDSTHSAWSGRIPRACARTVAGQQ